MTVGVRMMRDRILVRPLDRVKSQVLEVISKERPNVGEIVAAGPKCDAVKPGDLIRFGEFSFPAYELDGEQFLILQQADVAGVVEQ
jgi:chaperonin GroES